MKTKSKKSTLKQNDTELELLTDLGISRRLACQSVVAVAVSTALGSYADDAQANPLGWLFRMLFRARPRKRYRKRQSPRRTHRGAARSSTTQRTIERILDGYTAIDLIQTLSAPRGVIAVSDTVASELTQFKAETLWIQGQANAIRMEFENNTDTMLHRPTIWFEEENLRTGQIRTRSRPLFFRHDLAPGHREAIPADHLPSSAGIPLTINQSGPVVIRPYIPEHTSVYFDEMLVQVAAPGEYLTGRHL